jgi:molybdate transport system substrate-binding protein
VMCIRDITDMVSTLVAIGDIELGIVVTTKILTTPGVELAGRLPNEVNYYVVFVGSIITKTPVPAAARALLNYLTSPVAVQEITEQGMDAGG